MIMLFFDDTDITHIFKDKENLNIIIKYRLITQVKLLFLFEIQYPFANFIFEEICFYLLPGIAITIRDQ